MKIVKSLVVILAMAAMVVGSTGAIFTDQELIRGNTFAAGTLDIKMSKGYDNPLSAQNMAPGEVKSARYEVLNIGTLPVGKVTVSAVNPTGSPELFEKLEVLVERIIRPGYPDEHNETVFSGKLKDLAGQGNLLWYDITGPNNLPDGVLDMPHGWGVRADISVSLPADADNNYQNLSAGWDLVFDAVQVK